jgi:hypothetical protein
MKGALAAAVPKVLSLTPNTIHILFPWVIVLGKLILYSEMKYLLRATRSKALDYI